MQLHMKGCTEKNSVSHTKARFFPGETYILFSVKRAFCRWPGVLFVSLCFTIDTALDQMLHSMCTELFVLQYSTALHFIACLYAVTFV